MKIQVKEILMNFMHCRIDYITNKKSLEKRVRIHSDIQHKLNIHEQAWDEVRYFTPNEHCPLPENETLFELKL